MAHRRGAGLRLRCVRPLWVVRDAGVAAVHLTATRAVTAALLLWSVALAACADNRSPSAEVDHSARIEAVVWSTADVHGRPVAVLAVENSTGEISAAATAGDAANTPIDGGSRPAASLAKVVVLAAALESGVEPHDVLSVPQCIRVTDRLVCTTRPGAVNVAEAAAHSNNPAFVMLMDRSGLDTVVDYGAQVGMVLGPSRLLPLGFDAVRMESVAALFVALANDGETLAITDGNGSEVIGATGRLMRAETARAVRKVLRLVVTDGTGRAADGADEPYGKTGTAEGRTDAWFAGVSGDRTIVVWVGSGEGSLEGTPSATDPAAGVLADYETLFSELEQPTEDAALLTGGGLPARVFREVADLLAAPDQGA